ncbi:dihydropteroate synthase [Paucidesulfovibrio longus]|uniref:dihydropteroate synthase n=1 Tax=Paucidesulfovibrio longus TaxID=889 RepID=UPI0003B475E5|nr:dihydropteroate synthase [Paucidesulfovibrio longus]
MKLQQWTIARGRVLGPAPFFVAGIVNVTPDSFYDGGKCFDPAMAVAHGRSLALEGADILDVGGESTRPFSELVSLDEELSRVVPVVEALAAHDWSQLPRVGGEAPVVSVDTNKAEVARRCLDAGASIINDVSACRFDPSLLDVLVDRQPGYVLMHSLGLPREMQIEPRYDDVVSEILAFFEERLHFLTKAGLSESRIVLDPGIGFGKTLEHNMSILRDIDRFGMFGLPVYIGLSNKSLFGGLLGLEVGQRAGATQAATALLGYRGVAVHRVHEVAAARHALTLAQAMTQA